MTESATTSSLTIRVYIYTATNGYSWQGCDDDLAESLRSCLGSSWKNPASDGLPALGGIRRGSVGGFNGTAIYRVHVRKSGDFAGRDSDYVALAFIPFAQIGEHFVDYAGIWRHPLLAAPLGKDEKLAGLELDLKSAGLIKAAVSADESVSGDYWTGEGVPLAVATGGEADVLARLGAAFQSRKSELGSFVAAIYGDGDGRISLNLRYKPFPAVAEEASARKEYETLRRNSDDERVRAKAFKIWSETIETLLSMTDSRDGQFRHFLGLRQFAKTESEALNAGGGQEELKSVQRGLKYAEDVMNALGGHLTGEDGGILEVLERLLSDLKPLADQVGEGGEAVRKRLETLNHRLKETREESQAVARWTKWLKDPENGTGETKDGGITPPKTSEVLKSLAMSFQETRRSLKGLSRELEKKKDEIMKANKENDELKEKNDGLRKKLLDTSQDISSGAGQTQERVKPRSGILYNVLLGAMLGLFLIVVAILTALFWRHFLGRQNPAVAPVVESAMPKPVAATNAAPHADANLSPQGDEFKVEEPVLASGDRTDIIPQALPDATEKEEAADSGKSKEGE